jgi:DUF971 family protein
MDSLPGRKPVPPEAVRHRVEADGTLWIEWNDGHQTSIVPRRLRAGCPCAQCREEREAPRADRFTEGSPDGFGDDAEPGLLSPGSVHLVSIAAVGRYGLTPTWGDGHGKIGRAHV